MRYPAMIGRCGPTRLADPVLTLDVAEAIAATKAVQMFEVAIRSALLGQRRIGEHRMCVQEPALLQLPDADEQPRLQPFATATLVGLAMHISPSLRGAFVPGRGDGDPNPTAELARVLVLPELPAVARVPLHPALDAWRSGCRDQHPGRPDAARHLISVGVQVGEKLLALIAGPERRVGRAGAPAAAAEWGRDAPAAVATPDRVEGELVGQVDKTHGL
jgi:hypothetical protein